MKKLIFLIAGGVMVAGTSCKKYLDINDNPNSATTGTPEVVLPQALVFTASTMNTLNSYGSQLVGYAVNAGGYGGFGSSVTYNFGSSDYSGIWSNTFDNLNDYQYVINATDTIADYGMYNGAARIMKAFHYQMLVDTYNDVPYSDALKGTGSLTPKYDKAEAIYASLANQLDSGIASLKKAQASLDSDPNSNVKALKVNAGYDPLFKGDVKQWVRFANTIKLRLILRAGNKVAWKNPTFDALGFLTSDAIIQPTFIKDNGQQNPAYDTWSYKYDGSAGNKAWITSIYALGFYNGKKISDENRGTVMYQGYPNVAANQLGFESNSVPSCPAGSVWLPSLGSGALKGPNAGYPAMLAAESYFLQAEAVVRGIIPGNAEALFNKGIEASYTFLYKKADNVTLVGDPVADAAAYHDENDNTDNYLVNFNLATTFDEQIEAIITQKYIALNFVNGAEAFNEYRRTHYPVTAGNSDAVNSFASTQSTSTRPDKLPTRVLYPSTEASNNSGNLPKGINPNTSFIFWALQ
ncbi:SusD/RagB family nutrient-binding outer membrane lipoprotein [Deminuibacter soli]|uniref:SusD/RagB family nutrient-binding outer membrane lipoprotein n=1 Tax=Deminuibacter soli TaxID=2291815 RepID=A0A3E1NRH9_9BACT|nr:SusD/RagB family nutrient-binding outer membrane lipoprotein [Deminuibacter soli]RFM30546.1 SusD/RagB family nutrient-binding outer membrane lipoprotein [Deminuibacter soli]